MKTFTATFVALAAIVATAAASHYPNGCMAQFRRCNFRFHGYRYSIPTFSISGPADKAFTPRIVWKDQSKHIGVVNSNLKGAIVGRYGALRPISKVYTGGQKLSPTQFKPYTIIKKYHGKQMVTRYSGIGHEVFQGNQRAAENKCVLVRITHYQTLDKKYPYNVNGNVNGVADCVVFRTKA